MRCYLSARRKSVAPWLAVFAIVLTLCGLAAQRPTAAQYDALGEQAEAHFAWDDALGWYTAATTADTTLGASWLHLARIHFWQGNLPAATTEIIHAQHYAPHDASVFRWVGDIAAATYPEAAIAAWQKAIALAPSGADGQLAALHLADQCLTQANLAPLLSLPAITSAQVQVALAIAHLNQGEAASALGLLQDAPNSHMSRLYLPIAAGWRVSESDYQALGHADLLAGYPRLALVAFAHTSAAPQVALDQAWADWMSGENAQASASLAQSDSAMQTARGLGLHALLTTQPDEIQASLHAIDAWQTAHTPDPQLWQIAALVAQPHDPLRAYAYRWQYALSAPDDERPDAYRDLCAQALDAASLLKDDRGANACGMAFQLAPTDARAVTLAGRWAEAQGDINGALARYQRALVFDPTYAEAYLRLGMLAYRLDATWTARRDIAQALSMEPALVGELGTG